MRINVPALMNESVKFCDSRFNGFGMEYVSKNLGSRVTAPSAPFVRRWG